MAAQVEQRKAPISGFLFPEVCLVPTQTNTEMPSVSAPMRRRGDGLGAFTESNSTNVHRQMADGFFLKTAREKTKGTNWDGLA